MPPPPVFTTPARNKSSNLARSLRVRLKSFDSSLTRQINIGTGRMERHNLKVATTGKMRKSKSPRKTKNKSSRKHLSVTTPSKAKKFIPHKSKLAPGKQPKVFCPETPTHKVVGRKSDGNTSIADSPDKAEREGAKTITTPRMQQAGLARKEESFFLFWNWVKQCSEVSVFF